MLKSKIFESEFSDLKVEVIENGWITLYGAEGSMSVGKAPNERTRLIKEAIEYSENSEHNNVLQKKEVKKAINKHLNWDFHAKDNLLKELKLE